MRGACKKRFGQISLFLTVAITSVIGCPVLSSELSKRRPIIQRVVGQSVVLVTKSGEDGSYLGGGNGFFVTEGGLVITNLHVIKDAHHLKVSTRFGTEHPVTEVLAEDKEKDVALLSVDMRGYQVRPLQLCDSPVEVGQPILIVRSPLFSKTTRSEGTVFATFQITGFRDFIAVTASVFPGWSGSPIVNEDREVVGVVTSSIFIPDSITLAASTSVLKRLLLNQGLSVAKEGARRPVQSEHTAEDVFHSGRILRSLGQPDLAFDYFRRTIEIDPDHAEAHARVGLYYWLHGHNQEAIEHYEQSVLVGPDDPEKHLFLALLYRNAKRYDDAAGSCMEAIRLKPDHAAAYDDLALTYSLLKRYEDAIEAYQKLVRIDPTYDHAHRNLAFTYGRLGRYREATKTYEESVRLNPTDAHLHYMLALSHMWEADIWSALGEYQVLKDLDMDDANELFDSICGWHTEH